METIFFYVLGMAVAFYLMQAFYEPFHYEKDVDKAIAIVVLWPYAFVKLMIIPFIKILIRGVKKL